MQTSTRWPRWVAAMLALMLIAASCGGGSDDTADGDGDSGEETTETTSFDEAAAAEQDRTGEGETDETDDAATTDEGPVIGGTLVVSGNSDIANLDPITSSSFNTQYRLDNVYQRLISFETAPDIGYTTRVLQPELATDWEISDDLLTYTFNLREGVKWHNVAPVNGREFNSGDVKATLEAILAEGHQAALMTGVTSIETPDDYTVVLNLEAPFAPLLNNMASHFMWILPAEAFEEGYDRTNTVIGTGPWMMTEHEVDVRTVYDRNPDYWKTDDDGNQLPYIDQIEALVIKDTQQAIAAYKAGEIDIMTNAMSPELREQLMNDVPDGQFMEWIDAGMGQVGVNMEREPFNDLRVRQAISMAIDRQGMGDTIRGGGTIPSNVSPALADYSISEAERTELLPYDPDAAVALLAEAGYPDGLDATLIASDAYGPQYVAQAEWLVEDLKAIGINVTFELLDYATYFGSRWPDKEYDLQFGPQTPFLEPDEWLRLQMGSEGARNWYGISDPALDEMLAEQLTIVDPGERAEKIKEIQVYALENLMNPIPVWTTLTQWTYSPRLQGFYRHGSYGYANLDRAWLAEG
ncbi:MAG: ABC transporter substrate-binding protein [Acidimicrobiales bacterium]